MSRAPDKEVATIPMHAALSPYGVIDFSDNSNALHASPGVVGGPPAYLEAHGIRYVPVAAADSHADDSRLDADIGDLNLVPMGRDSNATVTVSQRELNSRVDDRIRQFMKNSKESLSNKYETEYIDNMHASRSELNMSRSAELRQLRRDLDTVRSHLAASSVSTNMLSDRDRLSALRGECDLAARTSQQKLRNKAGVGSYRRSKLDF